MEQNRAFLLFSWDGAWTWFEFHLSKIKPGSVSHTLKMVTANLFIVEQGGGAQREDFIKPMALLFQVLPSELHFVPSCLVDGCGKGGVWQFLVVVKCLGPCVDMRVCPACAVLLVS